MSLLLGLIGLITLTDAFDGHWSPRKEWEVVVGLVVLLVAAFVYCFGDERR